MKLRGLKETFKETLKIVYYYRTRAFFSLLGVAFGILSICVIITTIDGANRKAQEIFETLGPDSIMVFSGGERERMPRLRFNTLKEEDAEALRGIEGVYELVKGYLIRQVTVKYLDKKWQTRIEGVTDNYFESFKWRTIIGGYFGKKEMEERENVAVIGYKIYKEVFGEEDPVGKTIIVGAQPVTVLGVLEERGGGGHAHIDDRIMMPLTTVMERFAKDSKYITYIRLKTERDVDETMEDIRQILRKKHGLKEGMDDDFTVRSSRDVIEFLSVIKGSLYLFLGTASLIALLVSGFVLSSLFFLSIQERKKDIGIRRAYGATKKLILSSFLIESITITFFGGLLGILLSLFSKSTFEALFDIPMKFSLKVLFFSMLFSFLTGLFSGLRPAIRASNISPVEAIRS